MTPSAAAIYFAFNRTTVSITLQVEQRQLLTGSVTAPSPADWWPGLEIVGNEAHAVKFLYKLQPCGCGRIKTNYLSNTEFYVILSPTIPRRSWWRDWELFEVSGFRTSLLGDFWNTLFSASLCIDWVSYHLTICDKVFIHPGSLTGQVRPIRYVVK